MKSGMGSDSSAVSATLEMYEGNIRVNTVNRWGYVETLRIDEPTYPSKTAENSEPLGTCTKVEGNCSTRTVLGNLKCGPGPQLIDEENLLIRELNPQEGVLNLLKRVELKNLCCLSIQQVQQEVLHAKERLRHRKSTLSQCFAHAGYSF
jgi:hypothetical protein